MKQIPSLRHQAARPPGKRTRGFKAELFAHGVDLGRYPIVPDAYEFDESRRVLTLFEVVVTHQIDDRKVAKLRAIRDGLKLHGWRLHVRLAASCGGYVPFDLREGQIHSNYACLSLLRARGER